MKIHRNKLIALHRNRGSRSRRLVLLATVLGFATVLTGCGGGEIKKMKQENDNLRRELEESRRRTWMLAGVVGLVSIAVGGCLGAAKGSRIREDVMRDE